MQPFFFARNQYPNFIGLIIVTISITCDSGPTGSDQSWRPLAAVSNSTFSSTENIFQDSIIIVKEFVMNFARVTFEINAFAIYRTGFSLHTCKY